MLSRCNSTSSTTFSNSTFFSDTPFLPKNAKNRPKSVENQVFVVWFRFKALSNETNIGVRQILTDPIDFTYNSSITNIPSSRTMLITSISATYDFSLFLIGSFVSTNRKTATKILYFSRELSGKNPHKFQLVIEYSFVWIISCYSRRQLYMPLFGLFSNNQPLFRTDSQIL